MNRVNTKQGDTLIISASLQGADGEPQDLTAATVVFSMRTPATPTVASEVIVSRIACEVTDAAAGTVQYRDDTVGRTATENAGSFLGEFEVTFADGTVLTFPNDGDIDVRIAQQVA